MSHQIPAPPMGLRGPGGPGPGPQQSQGPPQGFPNQMPMRPQSSRIIDLTPQPGMQMMDETTAFKKLSTYVAFSIRKVVPNNLKEKATWARSEVQEEKLSQEDIVKQIKKLNEKGKSNEKRKSVGEKKLALGPKQGDQITNLLDDLAAKEHDRNFEWTLTQLDSKQRTLKNGGKETLTMTVFFKRSPVKELNPVLLYQGIERGKLERAQQQHQQQQMQQQQMQQQQIREQQMREQQQQIQQQQMREQQMREQQQRQQQPLPQHQNQKIPPPPNHGLPPKDKGAKEKGGNDEFIEILNHKPSRSTLPIHKKEGSRPPVIKKYHPNNKKNNYHSASSSEESDSDGSYTSDDGSDSLATSVSSQYNNRRYKDKKRTQSYERRREHSKDYHIEPRNVYSDHRPGNRPGIQHHYSVPEVPRPPIPGFDPVAAAYQAGKLDADAERHDLDRLEQEREMFELEHERMLMQQERLAQQQQQHRLMIDQRPVIIHEQPPIIVERAVPLNRPLPERRDQPRAMVSYGRADARRMSPAPRTYSDTGVRYDDGYPESDYFSRQEMDAESYMERTRPREYVDARPREYVSTRPREFVDPRPEEYVDTRPREYVNTRPREFVQERRRSDFVGQRPVEVRYQTISRPSAPRRFTVSQDPYR